jgi:hypothetical protein
MQDLFDAVDNALKSASPVEALQMLACEFHQMGRYDLQFEARSMAKRVELGLPPIQTESSTSFPEDLRPAYEEAIVAAAREAGELYLRAGNIPAGYHYFRAIGDTAPVAAAIEKAEPEETAVESVVAVAFQEGVHPAKGLELMLRHHGMCRAITAFGMYAVEKSREECLALLVNALYSEIVERMSRVIEAQEGAAPAAKRIPELMKDREWLFGEYDYYVDTSHLTSLIPYCMNVQNEETLRSLADLCEYGQRLSPHFAFRAQPPFEDGYVDYGHYIKAVLGEDADEHIQHFHAKAAGADPDEEGTDAAQLLVSLLHRLRRYGEALEVFTRYLKEEDPAYLRCPTAMQLCHAAADYKALQQIARERGDVLSYAAARFLDRNVREQPAS